MTLHFFVVFAIRFISAFIAPSETAARESETIITTGSAVEIDAGHYNETKVFRGKTSIYDTRLS